MRPFSRLILSALASLLLAGTAHAQITFWLDTAYGTPALHAGRPDGSYPAMLKLTAGTLPEGLAVDDVQQRLYWVESKFSGASIKSASVGFSDVQTVMTGASSLRGLAIDPSAGKLYWTASNLVTGGTVMRADENGANSQTLINLGSGGNPRGIAVDRFAGKLFFTDFDLGMIEEANLDGTGLVVLVSVGAGAHPYGIAVDPSAGYIYWTEYATGLLKRSTYAGGGVTTLVSALSNPTYLTFDRVGATLYWIDAGADAQHVMSAPLGGGAATSLPVSVTTFGGIVYATAATVAGVPAEDPLVTALALGRAQPNPMSGATQMELALPSETSVRVTVSDVQGRLVATLLDGIQPAGRTFVTWNARAGGRALPGGVYFVRMQAGGRELVRRVVLAP
jgi:streptogramin lyase